MDKERTGCLERGASLKLMQIQIQVPAIAMVLKPQEEQRALTKNSASYCASNCSEAGFLPRLPASPPPSTGMCPQEPRDTLTVPKQMGFPVMCSSPLGQGKHSCREQFCVKDFLNTLQLFICNSAGSWNQKRQVAWPIEY